MNLRAVVAVAYIVAFFVNLLYAILVAPTIIMEMPHLIFLYLAVVAVSLMFSFFGALLTVWIYKDGQNIKRLNWRVEYLERKIREQEKKE